MKARPLTLAPTLGLLLVACSPFLPAAANAAESTVASDLTAPAKRQATADLAIRLTRPPTPAPLPPDLPLPFNPPDFDKPGPDEGNVAGPGGAAAPGGGAAPASGGGAAAAANAAPAGPVGDRAILESLAAKIPSQGSFVFNGKRLLLVGKNRLEVGTTITVTDKATNQDYELQLVAIDATTFTLRYRGEDVTRPIKSVK